MGGTILLFEGKTPAEVQEKLDAQRLMAENMGLFVEEKTNPVFDEKRKVWWAGIKLHT